MLDASLDELDASGGGGGEGIARPGGVCGHLESAPDPAGPAGPVLPGLRTGRHDDGTPQDVPGLRKRGLL